MLQRRRFLRACLALLALPSVALAGAPALQAELLGTWDGTYEPPGIVGGDPCSLQVASVDGERVRGALVLPAGPVDFEGRWEAQRGGLTFEVPSDGDKLSIDLVLRDGNLSGFGTSGPWQYSFRVQRASQSVEERSHVPRAIDLSAAERPETYTQEGLETDVALELDDLVRAVADKNGVVGLSVACVVDGALVDVRSLGWEDFFAGVAASGDTRYRWGSISKPLTATAAAVLVKRGRLDLDADVRTLVPEFPVKELEGKAVKITPRLILCHQSGIVHYEGAQRVWREHATPDPFAELANGLDLFASSPLLFAPGTRFSYSTHAWTLLGVAMERAARQPFAQVVKELALDPFGMKTTEPDRVSKSIAHRAHGYELAADGRLVEIFDDDIAWKLPGGGWISTVGDLARFGAGLIGTQVLDDAMKRELWTPRTLASGEATNYGYGFEIGQLEGDRLVSHGGGQRKASTFLAVLPERRLAVAVMSNTARTPMEEIALGALRLLRSAAR